MENIYFLLETASKRLMIADHMTYVTFPLIKDKKLLIKILDELNSSLLNSINALLHHEYAYKRAVLYKDPKLNFKTFINCSQRYGINSSEIEKIGEIFTLIEKHKQSPMEFVKNDKFVILSDNLNTDTITLDKLKEYLFLTRNIFKKTETIIKSTTIGNRR
ncbi:hypothetical protein HZA33_00490 [Candidatus Pacearchaeota archaeon]|nr:hypothetical protein [Candidatus Pacearchaeota archaeon]